MQRARPGKPVDLIAHSQGGVVTLAFLLMYYDARDRSLPPLGNVVTLSSPLRGAPLAALAVALQRTALGRAVVRRIKFDGRSPHQLQERAALIRLIEAARLPKQIELTTIGAAADYVVPATTAHRPGSKQVDVDPIAPSPHTAIYNDPHALRAVRAALEHRAMPCMSLGEALDAAVLPVVITRVEHIGGHAAAVAS
jgi:pimeloyl-ACP methyl ester carboxylesterase